MKKQYGTDFILICEWKYAEIVRNKDDRERPTVFELELELKIQQCRRDVDTYSLIHSQEETFC